MIPDGGLHCNLNSWQRYLAAHLSEDEDFLPKDMWTYIHTPITQGFYGFGWMIDSSNNDIGDIVVYAMCVPTFQQELFCHTGEPTAITLPTVIFCQGK